jgi:hypothetical protein
LAEKTWQHKIQLMAPASSIFNRHRDYPLSPGVRGLVRLTLHAADHKCTEVSVPETLAEALPAAISLVRNDGGKFMGKAGLNRSVEVAAL